jgi:glycerophosphoryl diester phosphodiesterase
MKIKFWILPLLLIIVTGCSVAKDVEYVAHRGASRLAPENTLSSVSLAWQLGADAVEIDVYLTTDKRIVVIHDSDTKRVSGTDIKVAQANSKTLRGLDVGTWKDPKYAGEKIPFLEEVIEAIPEGKRLFVEVKCGKEIVPYLEEIINNSDKREQIIVISFRFDVLKASKERMPDIPCYWLLGTRQDKVTKKNLPHKPEWITKAKENNIDALNVHYVGINKAFMKAVKESGQDLYVWTVDDPKQAKRLIDIGVKGITTNRPNWLKHQMEHFGKTG